MHVVDTHTHIHTHTCTLICTHSYTHTYVDVLTNKALSFLCSAFDSVHRGGRTVWPHEGCIALYEASERKRQEDDAAHRRQIKAARRQAKALQEEKDLARDVSELYQTTALLRLTKARIKALKGKLRNCSCGDFIYRRWATCGRRDCRLLHNFDLK
jgi:hypothetical protein